ncbi:MAG: twin-arginine translocation signal domain-containing protein, partial [Acidimicrobiales bacterium]
MSACDFNRRQFLKYTGAVGAASIAATLTASDVAQAASVAPLPVGTPILVIVTLYGGNDGLNTVVPYTDPTYIAQR